MTDNDFKKAMAPSDASFLKGQEEYESGSEMTGA